MIGVPPLMCMSWSIPFVIVVGESMFSSSEIGLGKRRRLRNASCCSELGATRCLDLGVAMGVGNPGESNLASGGVLNPAKWPYMGVGIRLSVLIGREGAVRRRGGYAGEVPEPRKV